MFAGGTNWFRKRERRHSHRLSLVPRALSADPHSLSHTAEAESISRSRSRAGSSRSSYSSGSLSRRKIYVNRHVDTCSNVAGARARAERSEAREEEKVGGLGGLEVGLLVCSVGFRRVPGRKRKREGEKRTPLRCCTRERRRTLYACMHARSHTHTRTTRHARLAGRLMNQNYS